MDFDTPPAKAGRFLAGQPASHGSTETLDMQRCSPHRTTRGFYLMGSAMMPATRTDSCPRYFLFAVWRLWYGTSFEVPCRSNCSGRDREGLPPHCRLPRKTLTNTHEYRDCFTTLNEKSRGPPLIWWTFLHFRNNPDKTCQELVRHIRKNSEIESSNWLETGERLQSWPKSLNPQNRPSAIG